MDGKHGFDTHMYTYIRIHVHICSMRAELEDFGYVLPTDLDVDGEDGLNDKLLEHIFKLSQVCACLCT